MPTYTTPKILSNNWSYSSFMKYPTHLILDFSSSTLNSFSPYWVLLYPQLTKLNSSPKVLTKSTRATLKSTIFSTNTSHQQFTLLNSLTNFNIFFLRKEKIYTKLKYSRCPQYDMVSGGIAALLAGFIGFLICEKFGLELLDSGDFYIAFMYAVFLTFSLRPFLRIISPLSDSYQFLSPKFFISFYKNLTIVTFTTLYSRLTPINPSYTFKVSLDWLKTHEYASVLFNKVCYTIRFLKNYPKKVD